MKDVIIYTDGACLGNPGHGGWAGIIIYKGAEKEIFGREDNTTNNRMELLAAIKSLEELKTPCNVELYTDSQYVKNGIMSWIHNWKRNGWLSSTKKPVKNVDLWERLDYISSQHKINWHWVKGHSGHLYNERVDKLAFNAVKTI